MFWPQRFSLTSTLTSPCHRAQGALRSPSFTLPSFPDLTPPSWLFPAQLSYFSPDVTSSQASFFSLSTHRATNFLFCISFIPLINSIVMICLSLSQTISFLAAGIIYYTFVFCQLECTCGIYLIKVCWIKMSDI